jgi:hypothetical protein
MAKKPNPAELHRKTILTECQRRRINVWQDGRLWRLQGPGIDIATVDLAILKKTDLEPFDRYQKAM